MGALGRQRPGRMVGAVGKPNVWKVLGLAGIAGKLGGLAGVAGKVGAIAGKVGAVAGKIGDIAGKVGAVAGKVSSSVGSSPSVSSIASLTKWSPRSRCFPRESARARREDGS